MQEVATIQSHKTLLLCTIAFTVCFAAWMINGVLVTFVVDSGVFNWSSVQIGWLLGVPVLVGSVLRLPVGLVTDMYGGRPVMTTVILVSAIPMYLLSFADNYSRFLILSFGLGIAGSSFAAGVAFTSLWYPGRMQGMALGIFGAGNVGAAMTVLFAPRILNRLTENGLNPDAWRTLPVLYAALLLATALMFWIGTRNKKPDSIKTLRQRLLPLKELRVWRFGLFYFVAFGGFVALSQWLIPYYVNVYSMTIAAAGAMVAAFSLPAGLVRAIGGWLSDQVGARIMLLWVFGISLVCLVFLFIPRMEIQAPGQGLIASRAGRVVSVSPSTIVVEDDVYSLRSAFGDSSHVSIRFGIHRNQEKFLLLPTATFHQEPIVHEGDLVYKGQLLARGVTHIYFQANKWIFTALLFIIGLMMGFGGAAVYKQISDSYPANVGTVGGIVGVIGGLGGFFNPILFGYFLTATGIWTTCWMYLAVIVGICIVLLRISNRFSFNHETSGK